MIFPAQKEDKLEKYRPTEFDKKTHVRNLGWFRELLREDGVWEYEIIGREKYVFNLRGGEKLEIIHFEMKIENGECEWNDFLLAEIEREEVGYLYLGVHLPNRKDKTSKAVSDIDVLVKGLGIGGRLEAVKQLLLQRRANNIGVIKNVIFDENQIWIDKEMTQINRKFRKNSNLTEYKNNITELLIKRQNWLVIYGNGGKGNYEHHEIKSVFWGSEGKEIYKIYQPGEAIPRLNCEVKQTRVDLRKRASKFVNEE